MKKGPLTCSSHDFILGMPQIQQFSSEGWILCIEIRKFKSLSVLKNSIKHLDFRANLHKLVDQLTANQFNLNRPMHLSRRLFIKKMAMASSALTVLPCTLPARLRALKPSPEKLDISIFSKHLQFLDLKEAGQITAELGFDGVDLTVRPKGHVLPENVKLDLPKAIDDIKSAGVSCKMITTNIQDVSRPYDVAVIETAANYGVQFYRSGWFKYLRDHSMSESLEVYQEQIRKLGEINRSHNIVGCYQNHAGTSIGASFWEVKMLLQTVDTDYFGAQYDIRHATVEGGYSWENGLKLLKEHIKVIVLKDFKWSMVNGKWTIVNVPIGEGMVDFKKYFKLLKSYGLSPPVSLHLEYPLGGAEKGHDSLTVDKKVVFDAMKKDLSTIKKLWENA